MHPHPDIAHVDMPREVALPSFRLAPLSPEAIDEDCEAVMASAEVPKVLWGDRPEGLTREDDRIDLASHEREVTPRRSFSWIVRDAAAACLGCVYLFPDPGARGTAEVVWWLRDRPDRAILSARLREELAPWLAGRLPGGLALRWRGG